MLALIAQYHLTAKPQATGNIAATITQTMTGQVDVGFGAAPFGLDLVEHGKTRIVATGADVDALRTRVVRVNLIGAQTLASKHDAIVRFMQAYRETVDWMYSSPDALKIYGEYSGLPDSIVQRVVKLIPKAGAADRRDQGSRRRDGRCGGAEIPVGAADAGPGQRAGANSEMILDAGSRTQRAQKARA